MLQVATGGGRGSRPEADRRRTEEGGSERWCPHTRGSPPGEGEVPGQYATPSGDCPAYRAVGGGKGTEWVAKEAGRKTMNAQVEPVSAVCSW